MSLCWCRQHPILVILVCEPATAAFGADDLEAEWKQQGLTLSCLVHPVFLAPDVGVLAFERGRHTLAATLTNQAGEVEPIGKQDLCFQPTTLEILPVLFADALPRLGMQSCHVDLGWSGGGDGIDVAGSGADVSGLHHELGVSGFLGQEASPGKGVERRA